MLNPIIRQQSNEISSGGSQKKVQFEKTENEKLGTPRQVFSFSDSSTLRRESTSRGESLVDNLFKKFANVVKKEGNSIEKLFGAMDNDKDGVISKEEFKKALAGMKQVFNEEDIEEMLDHLDQNKDGTINFKAVSYTHLTLPTIYSV
eukprot:TRINITY_DN9834_c0_g1_i1.p1 TRINITY_DN9834_c0_g1~~TRINITY_DN9834_c0_g1_i1.p1  ORF type:complete len:147 (-),score=20.28 TRINITY_DN9834_c0_g1_i1:34-474(-)